MEGKSVRSLIRDYIGLFYSTEEKRRIAYESCEKRFEHYDIKILEKTLDKLKFNKTTFALKDIIDEYKVQKKLCEVKIYKENVSDLQEHMIDELYSTLTQENIKFVKKEAMRVMVEIGMNMEDPKVIEIAKLIFDNCLKKIIIREHFKIELKKKGYVFKGVAIAGDGTWIKDIGDYIYKVKTYGNMSR